MDLPAQVVTENDGSHYGWRFQSAPRKQQPVQVLSFFWPQYDERMRKICFLRLGEVIVCTVGKMTQLMLDSWGAMILPAQIVFIRWVVAVSRARPSSQSRFAPQELWPVQVLSSSGRSTTRACQRHASSGRAKSPSARWGR